jgi:hypothetical protein
MAMKTFPLATFHDRPYEIAKAIEDTPVMIIDNEGRHFGIFLSPDEYFALQEVAEIARDPEQYAKAVRPASDTDKTITYEDIFSD